MGIRKLFTFPGDLSLRFLLWRETLLVDMNFITFTWYYLLLPIVIVAHVLMIASDTIDDIFDHYKRD